MSGNNIIIVHESGSTSCVRSDQALRYDSMSLKAIQAEISGRRNIPNYDTIRIIKRIKINRKRIRLQLDKRRELRKCNLKNLKVFEHDDGNVGCVETAKEVKIATVNTRSIQNKIDLIIDTMRTDHINCVAIMETWLSNSTSDKEWLESQQLESFGFKCGNIARQTGQRGGGIALIYDKKMQITPINTPKRDSLESHCWSMELGLQRFILLVVYHPPASSKNQVPDSIFIDQFLVTVSDLIS